MLSDIIKAVEPMLNNTLKNYIVPGLHSHLVGGVHHGKVRIFQAERTTRDAITPHSHRFDFTCLVLRGTVHNTIYRAAYDHMGAKDKAELWCMSTIDQVCGKEGIRTFTHKRDDRPSEWISQTSCFEAGDTYSMAWDEIHSIVFERYALVMFFEGPEKTQRSNMIEPWVDGRVVPTFKTEDWMFEKMKDGPTWPL